MRTVFVMPASEPRSAKGIELETVFIVGLPSEFFRRIWSPPKVFAGI